ncbi:MAG: FIST N-terminal domain-containing protein [Chloroflexota bacterium]
MALSAAIGQSRLADAHDAGFQAAQQALEQLGRGRTAFALVVASHVHPAQQVLAGINDSLGETPVLGFSTSAELTSQGRSQRSVAVALFASDEVEARCGWWPDFVQDSRACTFNMLKALQPQAETGEILLLVADGLSGSAEYLGQETSQAGYALAGCLAGGDVGRGRTFQMGGRQSGSGGLAAAVLSGNIVIGVGAEHGWRPVGALARLTRVQGQWVRTLDDQPANELYARLFGYPAREWAYSPLNDLVRLYPLGLHTEEDVVVRAPLRMEADGSLRMNARLPEGAIVDIMVGSQDGCLEAARQATRQALDALGPTRPRLAVLLVDVAWQALLELQPGSEVQAVSQILGQEVPVIGGYTYGQVARLGQPGPVHLFNQHIEVVLFGVKEIEVQEGVL